MCISELKNFDCVLNVWKISFVLSVNRCIESLATLIKCLCVKYLIGIILYWIALNAILNCRPQTNWWFRKARRFDRQLCINDIHRIREQRNTKRAIISAETKGRTFKSFSHCIRTESYLHCENICFVLLLFFFHSYKDLKLSLHYVSALRCINPTLHICVYMKNAQFLICGSNQMQLFVFANTLYAHYTQRTHEFICYGMQNIFLEKRVNINRDMVKVEAFFYILLRIDWHIKVNRK